MSKTRSLKMLVKPGGKWYQDSDDMKSENIEETSSMTVVVSKLSPNELKPLRKSAEGLLEKDCVAYKQSCLQGDQKADFQWMEKMIRVGTLPDKMAAYVVKIQDSPLHNLSHLQNLISMVKVQSKQQCLMAADTLKDLFLEDLLPPDKKLTEFDKRGSRLVGSSKPQLIKFMYEDRLKLCYKSFIDSLRRMSMDNIEKMRAKSILIIFNLLSSHPEHEAELLQLLVNKLGDREKKIASRALFYLNLLLKHHPRMKIIVIDEVERLLFRNNMAKRAQYYGICFLSSINLHDEHPEVACKLISVYLAFFKGCIKTGDIDSKMMSGLLTGVNKAYPLSKEYGFKFSEHVDTMYKIVHMSNFNIGLQALSILFHLIDVDARPSEADRYYRVLYEEILRPEVATTSHNLQFLNLVYKSMKCDNNLNRIIGFCKRLLQICQNVQPNLACAILYMLSEVSKTHSGIIRVGESCKSSNGTPLESAEDNDETEEVMVDGSSANRMLDLVRISNVKVSSVDGVNYSNDATGHPQSHDQKARVKGNETCNLTGNKIKQKNITVVNLNTSDILEENTISGKTRVESYNPIARNPSFCGAELTLSHEVATLADHYHPSVALFAQALLQNQQIIYDGNPLKDFTITRFLERFVYKNAKKTKSAMGRPQSYQPKGLRSIPVNSTDYLKHTEESIPAEEKFFYRYFKECQPSKTDTPEECSDTESVGDEEFDELMANYFKSKKGKLDDGDDEDNDEFDIDFAADIHNKTPVVGKKRKKESESDDEIEDGSDVDDLDDDDDPYGPAADADEMLDLGEDYDDDLDFQDEEGLEVFENDYEEPKKKMKLGKKKTGIDMFAPAEKFAEMLESNADEGLSGPSTLINRENADPKQLKWEIERDRWVKGYKGSSKTIFKNKRRMQKRK